ncbi:helix-turn-helix transcriptional regulator [Streptomyces sp. ACA25]|uniref:helix-turn-helix domain-containing protein n=1 Tax=Streptomyces sp. ACA25 TaxID=3022596 RepID=UPI002308042F|nr:helix-turn-helix transcriptional regulator [Streptomyces sp. ACA25]MDB1086335.1 helix-turn-helix transcriptional regulator [Streptomyces sp. ACA25]
MKDRVEELPADGAAYFGSEVRHAREHLGMTQGELGERTQYSASAVGLFESGEQLATAEFAAGCDQVFATSGFFSRLRGRVSRRGHPDWFVPYLWLEAQAVSIQNYSAGLIMGALQTPAYAQAVLRAALPRAEEELIKEKVQARMQRREVLKKRDPPLLWAILDESCLRRPVGGPLVMREQLGHLMREAESPHVTLQVLPFGSGAPASHTSFGLLTFADEPGILYEESLSGGRVIDSSAKVAEATATYERLRADALSPDDSLAFIRLAMEEYAHEHHVRPLLRGVGQVQLQRRQRR